MNSSAKDIRLITLDPAHFHAALVQKEMYPEIGRQAHVYAPLSADLVLHLQRVADFNNRAKEPTAWELEVHAGPDYLERMLKERPGNVVVLAGRNRKKIAYIQAAVEAGLNVLADKPWIIVPEELPRLESVLDTAEKKGLIVYDIMTERHEITSNLQRLLVNDPEILGDRVAGTEAEPGVYMESVHFLYKQVAGSVLRRPPAYFDIHEQGEGLSDVGTHLVDLAPWILFPDQAIDQHKDVAIVAAARWPTVLTRENYQAVTGQPEFPPFLANAIRNERLEYFCNNRVSYTVRGVHVKLEVLWDFQSTTGGGDTHFAVFRGTRATIEVRQGKDQNYRPELFVVPAEGQKPAVKAALDRRVAALQAVYPGVTMEEKGDRLWVQIPDRFRVGHEAHFAEVTKKFLRYLSAPSTLPAWEKPNMLAKYAVTTRGVAQASSHGRYGELMNAREICQSWPFNWYGIWGFPEMQAPKMPLLESAIDPSWNPPDKDRLIEYLAKAPLSVVCGAMPTYTCRLCDARGSVGTFQSDGVWLWEVDLSHYVSAHSVVLPDRLVEHIRSRDYVPPKEAELRLPTHKLPWPDGWGHKVEWKPEYNWPVGHEGRRGLERPPRPDRL